MKGDFVFWEGFFMRKLLTAFAMTQSMFCAVPLPVQKWEESARSHMMVWLPVIGLEIGLIWFGIFHLLEFLAVPGLIGAAILSVIPFLLTGKIHLDGYLDVVDAVCSWRDAEKRREILKDPHVGSFAVVWCGILMLLQFAAFASMHAPSPVLVLIPVVSRSLAALAVIRLPPMQTSQYSGGIEYPKRHRAVLWIVVILSTAAAIALWKTAGIAIPAVIAGHCWALQRAYRSLEGMNGDIAGFCITVSELCGAVALSIVG